MALAGVRSSALMRPSFTRVLFQIVCATLSGSMLAACHIERALIERSG